MTQRIGRYEVLETLGKGGMGVVYRARDPELGRFVAIKVVLAWAQYDPDAMERFNREARVVAHLQHPHIVTVFDAGRTEDGLPYFVMELLQGTDLGDILGASGPLAPVRAVRYALQVCDGLTYAHARDIVHRDIKPANLLVTPDDKVKIVDFGIAKLIGSQITGSGVSLGTPLYMAPEQVAGRTVDHRADIFALGGVLYTLIAGSSPFEAPTLGGICHKIETESPKPLRKLGIDVSPQLDAIILRALEKDPEDRYQSVAALAEDLRAVEADLDAVATAPTVITADSPGVSPRTLTEPISAPRRRRPARALALSALAVVLAGAALWAFPELRPWPQSSESSTAVAEEEEGPVARDEAGAAVEEPSAESSQQTASEDATQGPAASTEPVPSTDVTPADPASPTGGQEEAPGPEPPSATVTEQPARDEAPPSLYPAGPIERSAVNRTVGELVRAIEAKDSAAIARLYGGRIPDRDWRVYSRLLQGPRLRIRHQIAGVGRTADGLVVAEVNNDVLVLGQPGRVPPPRTTTWVMRFQADKTGLYLVNVRPR